MSEVSNEYNVYELAYDNDRIMKTNERKKTKLPWPMAHETL